MSLDTICGRPSLNLTLPIDILEYCLSFCRHPRLCLICRRWCEAIHLKYVRARRWLTTEELDLFCKSRVLGLHQHFGPAPPSQEPEDMLANLQGLATLPTLASLFGIGVIRCSGSDVLNVLAKCTSAGQIPFFLNFPCTES